MKFSPASCCECVQKWNLLRVAVLRWAWSSTYFKTENMRMRRMCIQGHESWEIHWSATVVGEFLRISMPYLIGWPQCLRILKSNFRHFQTSNCLKFVRSKTSAVKPFRFKKLHVLWVCWSIHETHKKGPFAIVRNKSTVFFSLCLDTRYPRVEGKASRSMLSCVGALETQVCKWKSIGPTDPMVPTSAKHCETLKIFIGTQWAKVNHGQPQQQNQGTHKHWQRQTHLHCI